MRLPHQVGHKRGRLVLCCITALVVVMMAAVQQPAKPLWEPCYTHDTLAEFIARARTIALSSTRPNDQRIRGILPEGVNMQPQQIQDMTILPSVHYHDCQAVVSGNKHRAVIGLLGIQQNLQFTDRDFETRAGMAFPVALYIKLSPGKEYRPAGVRSGDQVNCLFIGLRSGGRPTSESAWWAGLDHCGLPYVNIQGNGALRAARWTSSDPNFNYLPVVRWHWNDRGNSHSYGTRCGNGWCAFLVGNSQPDPEWATGPCGNHYPGAVDVQPLAIGPGHRLSVRAGAAFICADPNLGRWTSENDFLVPRRVATVFVSGEAGGYKRVFSTTTAGTPNEILLRYVPNLETNPDLNWLMYVVRPDGTTSRYGVHKGGFDPGAPVATVRWQWHAEDEENWIWCVNGCCSSGF